MTGAVEDTGPYARPVRKRRWPIFLIALLAGGVSAAAVIALLGYARSDAATSGVEPEAAGAPSTNGERTLEPGHGEAQETEEGHDDPDTPSESEARGVAPPPSDPTNAESPRDPRPDPQASAMGPSPSMMGSTMTGPAPTMREPLPDTTPVNTSPVNMSPVDTSPMVETVPTMQPTGDELRRSARSALRGGNARECVRLAQQSVRRGGGPRALRLLADCQLTSGDRSGALSSYERFCRTNPTHPSIEAVRRTVASMGGSCP